LRAVGAALEQGRQALLLVPEITLTHQIVARVRSRFGDGLAVLHSGLRPGERLEQWQRLRAGATPIAVGARSALFAPLENLGVIVIDEEHDGAYKNEEGFLYHARQLAARRARHAGCPLVLGSATPSLETRFAADRGEVERLVLGHRIGRRPLPAVEIVDLTRERERDPKGRLPVLTRPLRRAISDALDEGGQAILFLNRRGFSTQVLCFDCGHAERCPRCDVALVYHATGQQLRCHYCEHTAPPPETCNGCGAPDTALLGLGTQRLEEEVRAVFPRARSARLDRDTAARRGYTQKVLEEMRRGELDLLIGTQMVAKGHDFPGVRVVGVVAADVGLHMPDFRASERTFQLLTQVAGRAGREGAPGRVVVQTFLPHHYAIAPVRHHDYERFYAEELSHRASLGFPPFSRILHVLVSSEDPEDAQQGAQTLAHAADGMLGSCERMGPAPAPLARLRGRHRVQMLVKGPDAAVHEIARALQESARKLPEGVHAHLDAHPIQML
ncbi:MAG: primosomal protein N', partial [Myxococcota bacterium]